MIKKGQLENIDKQIENNMREILTHGQISGLTNKNLI